MPLILLIYLYSSLFQFHNVQRPLKFDYKKFFDSIDLDCSTVATDSLVELCDGVYFLFSEAIEDHDAIKEKFKIIINDNPYVSKECVTDEMIKETLEHLFHETEKGFYVRDISKLPEGFCYRLAGIKSHIDVTDNQAENNPDIDDSPGINSPMLYVGTKGSHTPKHIEEEGLASINFLFKGWPKVWCTVDHTGRKMLTEKFAEYVKDNSSEEYCIQKLEHKIFTVHPKLLDKWGIPYRILIQYPGDLFFIRSNTYHTVVNMGQNVAEAINVGNDQWNFSYEPPLCKCEENNRKSVPKNRAIAHFVKKEGSYTFVMLKYATDDSLLYVVSKHT